MKSVYCPVAIYMYILVYNHMFYGKLCLIINVLSLSQSYKQNCTLYVPYKVLVLLRNDGPTNDIQICIHAFDTNCKWSIFLIHECIMEIYSHPHLVLEDLEISVFDLMCNQIYFCNPIGEDSTIIHDYQLSSIKIMITVLCRPIFITS